MKKYKIPIVWSSIKEFEVEANNLQDAVSNALREFLAIPDENYLSDSFEVDEIVEDDYDETYDIQKAIKEI